MIGVEQGVLTALVAAVAGSFGAFLTYRLNARKGSSQVSISEAKAASELFAEFAERAATRLDHAEGKLDEVREDLNQANEQITLMRAQQKICNDQLELLRHRLEANNE